MPEHEASLVLDTAIPEPLVAEVLDKLAYASPHIRRCTLSDDRAQLAIFVDQTGDVSGTLQSVRDTVRALVHDYRDVDKAELWRHACPPANVAPIWDDLVAAGVVHEEAPGCVALLGDTCHVALAIDALFATLAREVFGAVPHQYPTLLPIAAMERCDYFASFPHHVTFAPHVVADVDKIARIGEAAPAERGAAIDAALARPSHALSPSVCFHTYAALADSTVRPPFVATAVNRCYRWEATHFASCERLWDFTMREIVFVGDPAWIEDQRQRAIREIRRIVEDLQLDAWLETANDPFFVGRFAAKRYFQLLRRAKYELRLTLPYARSSLSAASFNVHEDFFGRSFAIRGTDEDFVSTGCAGFGIERWMWALYAQHGTSITSWPTTARRRLGL